MPTDPVAAPNASGPVAFAEHFRLWVDAGSLRTKVASAALVALIAGGAWLALRPTSHPDIATMLPRASASGPSATSASGASSGSSSVAASSTGGTASSSSSSASGASGSGGAGVLFVVHVVGSVATPGVVRVPAGSRVLDAVGAAGGFTLDADRMRINLAAKVVDGQRIMVPAVGEPLVAVADGGGDATASSTDGAAAAPININDATEAQLDELPGVGPATAAAIIAYRTQHGPFRSVDALGDVHGIGPSKLEQIRPRVTV